VAEAGAAHSPIQQAELAQSFASARVREPGHIVQENAAKRILVNIFLVCQLPEDAEAAVDISASSCRETGRAPDANRSGCRP
jgi:hypothetical protein